MIFQQSQNLDGKEGEWGLAKAGHKLQEKRRELGLTFFQINFYHLSTTQNNKYYFHCTAKILLYTFNWLIQCTIIY